MEVVMVSWVTWMVGDDGELGKETRTNSKFF